MLWLMCEWIFVLVNDDDYYYYYYFFFFFFFCVNLLYLAIIDMLCKKIKSAFLGQLWVFSGYGRSKYNAYKLCFIMYTKNGYNN